MIPDKHYCLTLADGSEVFMNLNMHEDWMRIQKMADRVGWQDDNGALVEIADVYDIDMEDHLVPICWAKEDVWIYGKCWGL